MNNKHDKKPFEAAMNECLEIKKEYGNIKNASWELLAKKYGYKNGESIRCTFRNWRKKQNLICQEETSKEYKVNCIKTVPVPDIKTELTKDVTKGISVNDALEKYQIKKHTLEVYLDQLRRKGLNVQVTGDVIHVSKYVVYQDNIRINDWSSDEKILRFGVVADTHIGSKYQQISLLDKVYDVFVSEGLEDVYHAGDISEGIKMRPGHEQECFLHGSDDVEDYIIENYPKKDTITTHFITGNHDHTFIKQSGHDIGKRIAAERKDMDYLGMSNAKIYLTPNCTMELNHPLDGAAYALSYSIQKMADSLSGGEKPGILINGHHHKAMYLFYRNIHMLEAGCFQAQTPWMRGKRIAAMVGGYIVTVHVDETGEIKRFLPEFVPFYEMIKEDWK